MSLSRSRIIVWMAWGIASVFYAYQYILRVMPNVMLNDIMQQFQIDAAAFGQFSGIYYISYSLMHLPLGICLDRYGPKKVMSICSLLTVVGLSPLIFAQHWIYPVIGRFLIGLGSSAAILGVFKIIRMMFAEKHFARMLSLSVTIGLAGAIYGGRPVSYLCTSLGSQAVIYLFAALGIGLAIVTYWIVPNTRHSSQGPVISDIKAILHHPKVLWSCICAGLMVGPLEGFADVWGTAFLKQVFGFEQNIAASLPSMIFIGMCFGSPLLSFIAGKVGDYLLTIMGAGVIMAISFGLLLLCPLNPMTVSIGFVIVGICCAYQILAIYKASTWVPEQMAGLATAIANMIIMIFGYVFHSIIGGIVGAMGGPSVSNALFYGVITIPVALSLGSIGFFLIWVQEKKRLAASRPVQNVGSDG
jgi:predicted MFS family arabinose efflux permease